MRHRCRFDHVDGLPATLVCATCGDTVDEGEGVLSVNKYGAVRTEVNGVTFASKKEARRYWELCVLQKAGDIFDLVLQPVFPLFVLNHGGAKLIGKYIADFSYRRYDTRALVVEDVKGVRTPLYRWKKKHVEAQYEITVTEI